MEAGRLDRFIAIQRKSVTQSPSGEQIEAWTALDARRPAQVFPVKGEERLTDAEISAAQQVQFVIRYSDRVKDVSPLDRIVYPAATSNIPASSIYNIIEVSEIGRRSGLKIIASRKPDAS